MGRENVGNHSRTGPVNLVGRHRRAYATATDSKTALDFAGGHCPGQRHYKIGIIILGMAFRGAKVNHLVLGFAQGIGQWFFERKSSVIGGNTYAHGRLEIAIRDSSKPSRLGQDGPYYHHPCGGRQEPLKTECPPLTHAQPADHHDDDDTQNPYRHLRRKLDEKQPPTGGAEVRALGILILIESLGTKRTTKSMTHAGQKSWGREKGDSCHLPQRPEGGHHPCMVVAQMAPATFFPSTSLVKRGILPK